jgi:hypothetical protein
MPTNTPTFDALRTLYRTEAVNADGRLTDWSAGSVNNAHATAGAALANEVVGVALAKGEESFVTLARGTALDARIVDFGGPVRKTPNAAVAACTVTRGAYVGAYTLVAGTEVTGTAPDGRVLSFTIDADIVLGAPASEASGTMTCSFTGPDGNVPAGTVETVTLPDGLTFSQDERAAGGDDGEPYTEEGDEAYRQRFYLEIAAREKGTVEALEAAALSVPGIRYATVDESTSGCSDGGYVSIYVGDPDAEANNTLLEAVEAAVDLARAAGIEVRAFASQRQEEAFEFIIFLPADSPYTETDCVNAFVAWINGGNGRLGLSPNEPYTSSKAIAAIHRALDPLDEGKVILVKQTFPLADSIVPTNPYNAIRTADDGSDVYFDVRYG